MSAIGRGPAYHAVGADLAEPFYMAMRNYGPQEPVPLNDEWEPPAVERFE